MSTIALHLLSVCDSWRSCFNCDRMTQRLKVSSITSSRLRDQITTQNNLYVHWETWYWPEWRQRRRLFAGQL